MDGELALVALLCRTSDRSPAGSEGAALLVDALAERTGSSARHVGSTGDCHIGSWDDDLRAAHGCLLEAGGQVEDAIIAGRLPVLCASDCSICMTTLPTVARLADHPLVLWLDAHGDFNTPESTASGFLGGMCLAGACGLWDTGFDGRVLPTSVLVVGSRDVEDQEGADLDRNGVLRMDALSDVVDAVDGRDVFVHLDLDVLEDWPAEFPAPGGQSVAELARMLDEVAQAAQRIVGVEITSCAPGHTDDAADAVMPLLPIG